MSRPYNSNERENRTMQKNITLIYGDCSSPEIVTQAVRVLDKIAARHGHTFTYTRAYMGGEAIDRFGDPLPASELEKCKSSDSVLLGAIGGPKWEGLPGDQRPEKGLLRLRAGMGLYANNRTVFHQQLINHQLLQLQILLVLDNLFHQRVIKRLILLTAQSMHGIALTGIQKAHLDTCQIRTDTHLAAQSIKLTHQMAFCRTADRRIARHQRHIIQRQRRQQRLAAQAGGSQRRLHTCVAGTNDNYIKCICNITHLNRPLKNICTGYHPFT